MTFPNPQDPNSPLYQFIDQQPPSVFPNNPDSSPSNFTTRQFTPEGITNTYPMIVTLTNHGFLNGQALRFTKFVTLPFARATGMEQLNNNLYYVQQSTANTFVLSDVNTLPIDGRNFTPYISGGQMILTGADILIVNPSQFPPPGIVVPLV
jgi:hypothetical protein